MEPGEYVEMRLMHWARPVEVLRARYTTFEFPTHAHAEYAIGEVLQGSELFAHHGKEVEAPTGWFFHLNPSEAHNGRAAHGSWTYVALYPSVEFLRFVLPDLCAGGDPHFTAPVSHRPTIQGRLAHFVTRVFEGADDLALQSELFDILGALLRPVAGPVAKPAPTSRRSAAVRRVRDRLADEWCSNVSLVELADSVALTPLALLRAFRAEVGCTPQAYRTARRLEVARRMLREGGELAAVALRSGFSDQSHFTNTFRKWTGLTPGKYQAYARRSV